MRLVIRAAAGSVVVAEGQHREEGLLRDLDRPTCFIRFLPAFCFFSSFCLRVTSPP